MNAMTLPLIAATLLFGAAGFWWLDRRHARALRELRSAREEIEEREQTISRLRKQGHEAERSAANAMETAGTFAARAQKAEQKAADLQASHDNEYSRRVTAESKLARVRDVIVPAAG